MEREIKFRGTKGEWEVAGFPSVQVKDTDWCIADCEQSANDEENYANAKLISKAPLLLETLQTIKEILESPKLIDAGNLRRLVNHAIEEAV